MIRIPLLASAALLVLAVPVLAQDPTKVDSDHYKVAFENDEVRVLNITYGPGEKSVMHWHPDAVAVMLTPGKMVMHTPDGEAVEMEWPAGSTLWTPAVKHQPENVSDGEVRVILIEMKDDHEGHMEEHEGHMEEHEGHMEEHEGHMEEHEGHMEDDGDEGGR